MWPIMLMQYRLDQGYPPPPVMEKHLLVIIGKVIPYTQASTVRIWCNIGVKIMVIVVYTGSLFSSTQAFFFVHTNFVSCMPLFAVMKHNLMCTEIHFGGYKTSLGFWGIESSCVQKLLFGCTNFLCVEDIWGYVESSCVWKIYSRVYRDFLIHKQPSEVVIGSTYSRRMCMVCGSTCGMSPREV